jgi:HK97 family phage major capsid protein
MSSAVIGLLDALRNRRREMATTLTRQLETAQRSGREQMTANERAAISDIRDLDARIAEMETEAARGDFSALSVCIGSSSSPPKKPPMKNFDNPALTYRQHDHSTSWLRDLVRVQTGRDDTGEARDRLMSHAADVQQLPEYTEYRDRSRVDGSGGYGAPPAWLMDQYIELARPGRAFANLVQRQPLPGGTDSINIPKLLTGTSTAIQTADNTPVSETDLTDTFINAPVRTISGQQAVAIQLLDQSPVNFDEVVFSDLVADYAAQVDRQVISGTGANGQVLGVSLTPGIQTVPASGVTIQNVYSAIANAVQKIHTTRFLPPECIVMHPRRWGWFLSLLDNQDRPLFLPAANQPQNAAGILSAVAAEQVVGQMHGLPVVTDPNITTTDGPGTAAGTNDVIYVLRASDVVLWESGIRARVLPETKAQNLTVLLQIFGYLAFSAARYPQSIAEITRLTAPTW